MKKKILNLLKVWMSFLNHILQMGLKDGIHFFYFNPVKSKEYIFKTKNIKHPFYIRGNTSDRAVMDQIFYQKDYEISLDFEPKVIIDCGANIGLASIYFKNIYPNAQLIAIEPEHSNFELLKKNTINYSDIILEKKGIWKENCFLEICQGEDKKSWSFYLKPTKESSVNSVEALSMDSIISKYNISSIDILKIDIEGAESELFEMNFENWILKTKIIIIELHDRYKNQSSKNFFNVLSKYNFNVYFKGENLIAERVEE